MNLLLQAEVAGKLGLSDKRLKYLMSLDSEALDEPHSTEALGKISYRSFFVQAISDDPLLDIIGFGSNIGHGLFIGWVESAGGGLGFSASGGPTCLLSIFVLSAKPNKMVEDGTIAMSSFHRKWL